MIHHDTIIVGAGSAGGTLAARLSEDPSRSILLIEAGPDYPDPALVPPDILSGNALTYTHEWGYQSQSFGEGRIVPLRRAKITGGCSATNACIALRGSPSDYDSWGNAGNDGWSFRDVLPFFLKLENDIDFADEWHNQRGPIPIRRFTPDELTPVQSAFIAACLHTGFPFTDDHNHPGASGAGYFPMNLVNGVRQSVALTYLRQARSRRNLRVLPGTTVERVLFEGDTAVGVAVRDGSGNIERLLAGNVVLSAGSYASPVILMRSGVGDQKILEPIGIKTIHHLPGVGKNLQDHPLIGFHFGALNTRSGTDIPHYQTLLTLRSEGEHPTPDLMIFPISAVPAEKQKSPTGSLATIIVGLMKPHSRGWIQIRSAAVEAPPIIQPGYFTDPGDIPRIVQGIQHMLQIVRAPEAQEELIQPIGFSFSQFEPTESIAKYILSNAGTYHHPTGTCKMGPAGDAGAVVGSRCNVHGVKNLSVVDASVMPEVPSANTNIPTIMLAERCAGWL